MKHAGEGSNQCRLAQIEALNDQAQKRENNTRPGHEQKGNLRSVGDVRHGLHPTSAHWL